MGGNKNATFYDVQRDFYKYWDQRYERTGAKPGKGLGYKVFKRYPFTYTLMKLISSNQWGGKPKAKS